MGQLPTRKRNRLQNYDYSRPCAALITICAEAPGPTFGMVDASLVPPTTILSPVGQQVQQAIHEISQYYPSVSVDSHSILPDHVHLLLRLRPVEQDPPSVSRIVRMMKRAVTKQAGHTVWQKGFHDHIIRTEEDYQNAWNYVQYNASKWVAQGKPTIQNSAGRQDGG